VASVKDFEIKTDFTIVTTFNNSGWRQYGSRFAFSLDKYLPEEINVFLYYENMENPVGYSERMRFLNFNDCCGQKQKKFENLAAPHEAKKKSVGQNSSDYTFQASRFAHKYYACEHALTITKTRYLIWIDADVVTLRSIPKQWFYSLVEEKKYWSRIGRGAKYPECGFMIWDLTHPQHKSYWSIMESMYDDGKCFDLPEWHDSFIWWTAEKIIKKKISKEISFNLGDDLKGHAFVRGVIGEYFDHLKGERKNIGFSPERKNYFVKQIANTILRIKKYI
jgi:hypothetical protein